MFKKLIYWLLYKVAFNIGSQNEGYFGLSFRAVSYFHIGLKIWKYRWSFGWWDMDGSDPERFPMLNKIGWTHHWYAPFKYSNRPWKPCIAWKPIWSTYYGCFFNRGFYFEKSIYPIPEGCMEPSENVKARNKQFAGYPGIDSVIMQWIDDIPEVVQLTSAELYRLERLVSRLRNSDLDFATHAMHVQSTDGA